MRLVMDVARAIVETQAVMMGFHEVRDKACYPFEPGAGRSPINQPFYPVSIAGESDIREHMTSLVACAGGAIKALWIKRTCRIGKVQ